MYILWSVLALWYIPVTLFKNVYIFVYTFEYSFEYSFEYTFEYTFLYNNLYIFEYSFVFNILYIPLLYKRALSPTLAVSQNTIYWKDTK